MNDVKRKGSNAPILVTLSLILLIMTACSGGSRNSPDTVPSGSASDQKEPVTLTILSTAQTQKPEGGVENEFAAAFMAENPHVTIEFISVPTNEASAKVVTMATGKQLPDIFVNTPEFYAQAYEMGITEDLTPLLGEEFVKGFHPAAIEQSTIDGQLQFMPNFTIPMALLYRSDWLEEEGLTPPETWEQFLEAAEKLTKDTDGDGAVDRWGFGMVGTKNASGASRYVPMMRTFGVQEIFEKDGKWDTQFDSQESIEFLTLFTDLAKNNLVPDGAIQTGYAEAVTLMATEKIGMMITGPHTTGAVFAQNPDLEGKLAGVPVPKRVEHVSSLGSLGYSISKDSRNKELAAEYLRFTMKDENVIRWGEVTGRLPSRLEPAKDPRLNNEMFSGFIEAMDYSYKLPNVPFYTKVYDYIGEAYQSVITAQATPEEAAKRAAENIRAEIGRNS